MVLLKKRLIKEYNGLMHFFSTQFEECHQHILKNKRLDLNMHVLYLTHLFSHEFMYCVKLPPQKLPILIHAARNFIISMSMNLTSFVKTQITYSNHNKAYVT